MSNVIVKIEKIDVEDVLLNNKDKYNNNNHWDNGKPNDYYEVLAKSNTGNWIDAFHSNYKTITIDKYNLTWMKEAFQVGRFTGTFSKLFDEDLNDMLIEYKEQTDKLFDGTKYFIRTEKVSLKYGQHKEGPYTNFQSIIESMVTSIDGHTCFDNDDIECKIYLMTWLEDFDFEKEFRIFVYKNHITAISQQNLFAHNKWLSSKTNEELSKLVNKIVTFFNNNIRDKIKLDNFVMDLGLIGDDENPYFIEPNSFGKEYASGSSLFCWLNNYDELYNDTNTNVSFRFA